MHSSQNAIIEVKLNQPKLPSTLLYIHIQYPSWNYSQHFLKIDLYVRYLTQPCDEYVKKVGFRGGTIFVIYIYVYNRHINIYIEMKTLESMVWNWNAPSDFPSESPFNEVLAPSLGTWMVEGDPGKITVDDWFVTKNWGFNHQTYGDIKILISEYKWWTVYDIVDRELFFLVGWLVNSTNQY